MREADYLSSREVPKEEAMHIIQIKRYQSPTGEMLIGTFENPAYATGQKVADGKVTTAGSRKP